LFARSLLLEQVDSLCERQVWRDYMKVREEVAATYVQLFEKENLAGE
jgi:hypothetical protein